MDRPTRIASAAAIALLGALTAGAGAARAAEARSVSATIAVSIEVLPHCTVAVEPLAFSAVTTAQAPSHAATASIEVACGPDVPFTVALDDGQYRASGSRRAFDPATGRYIGYDIFADAAHTRRWGGLGGQSVAGVTPPAGTTMLTAYGRIGSETQVAAGSYGDVVTVTTNF